MDILTCFSLEFVDREAALFAGFHQSLLEKRTCVQILKDWNGDASQKIVKVAGGNQFTLVCACYDPLKTTNNCNFRIPFGVRQKSSNPNYKHTVGSLFIRDKQGLQLTHNKDYCKQNTDVSNAYAAALIKKLFTGSNKKRVQIDAIKDHLMSLGVKLTGDPDPISGPASVVRRLNKIRILAELSLNSEMEGLGLLQSYLDKFAELNIGTIHSFDVTMDPVDPTKQRFRRVFVMPAQMATIFKNAETNYAAIDASFIHNNNHEGHCIVLESIDGNGHCYPLAVALVDGESSSNYIWFLRLVCRDPAIKAILDNGKCVLMSDRHRSIKRAVFTVLKFVIHRKCFLHIIRNIEQNKIHVNEPLRRKLWDICLAPTREIFYQLMEALLVSDAKCYDYLRLIDPMDYAVYRMYEEGLCTYGRTTSNDVEQEMNRSVVLLNKYNHLI
jgi:hypothetical protein